MLFRSNKELDKIEIKELDTEKVIINKTAETDAILKGYMNVALFGVDENKTNTDTIIIASINNDTKEVRLVSVYRDTYLNIGEDRYNTISVSVTPLLSLISCCMAGTICFLSVLKLSADNFTFAVPAPLMTTLTRASFSSGSGYI